MKLLGDPMNYKSAGVFDPGLPGWQGFESGAMPNLPGKMGQRLSIPRSRTSCAAWALLARG